MSSGRKEKARRSAAAKKGWETRRAQSAGYISYVSSISPAMLEGIRMHAAMTAPVADPNPWPRIAANLKRWALSPVGWFRREP